MPENAPTLREPFPNAATFLPPSTLTGLIDEAWRGNNMADNAERTTATGKRTAFYLRTFNKRGNFSLQVGSLRSTPYRWEIKYTVNYLGVMPRTNWVNDIEGN